MNIVSLQNPEAIKPLPAVSQKSKTSHMAQHQTRLHLKIQAPSGPSKLDPELKARNTNCQSTTRQTKQQTHNKINQISDLSHDPSAIFKIRAPLRPMQNHETKTNFNITTSIQIRGPLRPVHMKSKKHNQNHVQTRKTKMKQKIFLWLILPNNHEIQWHNTNTLLENNFFLTDTNHTKTKWYDHTGSKTFDDNPLHKSYHRDSKW